MYGSIAMLIVGLIRSLPFPSIYQKDNCRAFSGWPSIRQTETCANATTIQVDAWLSTRRLKATNAFVLTTSSGPALDMPINATKARIAPQIAKPTHAVSVGVAIALPTVVIDVKWHYNHEMNNEYVMTTNRFIGWASNKADDIFTVFFCFVVR